MSNLITFRLLVSETRLDEFITALASVLEPAACCDTKPTQPPGTRSTLASTFMSLRAGELQDACLSLAFSEDEELKAHRAYDTEATSRLAGKIAVGCFWTTCKVANGQCEIEFTSATSSISRLMKFSPSVRSTFMKLGELSMTGTVTVIDEWHWESVLQNTDL